MRFRTARLLAYLLLAPSWVGAQAPKARQTVIAASVVLDGKGSVLRNTRIVVRDGFIVALDPKAGPIDHDLRGYTVMPGWIDSHAHITWGFGQDGKNAGMADSSQYAAVATATNLYATLMGGFTTVQSVGSKYDPVYREAVNSGKLPGPRILTSLEPISPAAMTPDAIREAVKKRKQDGADLIKIMCVAVPGQTLTTEKMLAACGEAKAQGLRTLVHAYSGFIRIAVEAGCTQIEHGRKATQDELLLMAGIGCYFDPQGGLLYENYYTNRSKFAGTPFFPTDESVFVKRYNEDMPLEFDLMRRAYKTPKLLIVFGTDAAAGTHGRNADEFIFRVRDGGVDPMTALVSAQSLAAKAMGMEGQLGSIAPNMRADIIALRGDPLKNISVVKEVVFVMKEGIVYKSK